MRDLLRSSEYLSEEWGVFNFISILWTKSQIISKYMTKIYIYQFHG